MWAPVKLANSQYQEASDRSAGLHRVSVEFEKLSTANSRLGAVGVPTVTAFDASGTFCSLNCVELHTQPHRPAATRRNSHHSRTVRYW